MAIFLEGATTASTKLVWRNMFGLAAIAEKNSWIKICHRF
jgi:hypothetical protein